MFVCTKLVTLISLLQSPSMKVLFSSIEDIVLFEIEFGVFRRTKIIQIFYKNGIPAVCFSENVLKYLQFGTCGGSGPLFRRGVAHAVRQPAGGAENISYFCSDETHETMEELTLTTPALLFSAVSLILLAYTNRFLSYAQLVRTLKEQHLQHPSQVTRAQIDNLRRRLHLTRTMQTLGVSSLFLCVVTMFLIYVGLDRLSAYVFGAALLLLIGSLGVSIHEIRISVRALEIHLRDMER